MVSAVGVSPVSKASKFLRWRWTLYASLFFGWCSYYFCRKSFPSSIPNLIADNGLTKDDIGTISSCFAVAYGFSKFFNSLLSDHVSAKKMFSVGLVLSGLGCIAFPFATHSVPLSASLWFIEGVIQGFGWAPCAKLLKEWYPPSQMGTWWSILSSAGNVAAAISPLLITFLSSVFDWRISFHVIGAVTIAIGVAVLFLMKDSPSELGVELTFQKPKSDEKVKAEVINSTSLRWYSPILYRDVWVASGVYAALYVIKNAVADWSILYFMQVAGKSQTVAAACVGMMQFGGIMGLLVTGYVSDLVMTSVRRISCCDMLHFSLVFSLCFV